MTARAAHRARSGFDRALRAELTGRAEVDVVWFTILVATTACAPVPIEPELSACERFFLERLEGRCADVTKAEPTCDALDCSQTAVAFDNTCRDPAACCAYRDCWSDYAECMGTCSGPSDFERCADTLDDCVDEELEGS